MKKKLVFALFLTVVMTASFVAFGSCKRSNKNDTATGGDVSTIEDEIILAYADKNITLIVGDEKIPQLNYTVLVGKQPQFTSSDPSVASVDGEGNVKANRQGEAVITATYENKTSSVNVSVSYGDYVPYIEFAADMEESITIGKSSQINLNAVVRFNGKSFNDATFRYEVTNELGRIENGTFLPDKKGEGEITVRATWRNYEGFELSKKLRVSVVSEVQLFVNDNGTNSFELYTKSEFGGKIYDNVLPFVAKGYIDGQAVKPSVSIIDGEDKISYNEENQTITGIRAGAASIRLTYDIYSHDVNISVLPTIAKYNGARIEFSALDGDLPLTEIFGKEVEIISAYDDQTKYEIVDNKIVGITVDGKTTPKERVITVCSDECGYEVSIVAYTKIIKTGKDLEIFNLGDNVKINDGAVVGNVLDGYYVLADNVNASDYQSNVKYNIHPMNCTLLQNGAGLTGTFDGRGYTITNLTLGDFGLFGIVSGTIKNVAFKNVNFLSKGTNYNYVLANYIGNTACVENVYIKCKEMGYVGSRATVANVVREKSDFNNCIFVLDYIRLEISESTITDATIGSKNLPYSYGSLSSTDYSRFSWVGNTTEKAWKNVYVISPYYLTAVCDSGFTTVIIDGENNPKGNYVIANSNTIITVKDEQIKGSVENYSNLPVTATEGDVYTVEKETRGSGNKLFFAKNTKFIYQDGKWKELITYLNYGGVKRYESVETMVAADIDYADFAQSGCWSLFDNYIPVWTTTGDFPEQDTDLYFELDQRTGEIDVAEIFGTSVTIEKVSVRTDEGLTAKIDGNVLKIYNGTEEFVADGKVRQLAFYTNEGITPVNVKICTAIINTAEDLQEVFKIRSGKLVDYDSWNKQIEIDDEFNGYYLLANNIECKDTDKIHTVIADGVLTDAMRNVNTLYNRLPYFKGGLTGTFDGNGHTISGLKIGDWGLFGIVNGGKVKNVALKNVKLYAKAYGAKCTLGASIHNAEIENVYISAEQIDDKALRADGTTVENDDASSKRALLTIIMGTVKMNNCVFECGTIAGKDKEYSFGYGSLAAYDNVTLNKYAVDKEKKREWNNVYVISKESLVSHSVNLTKSAITVIDAYNKKSTHDESVAYLKSVGDIDDIAQGIKRYDSQDEMKRARNDLESFSNNKFWVVNDGFVEWKK